MAATLGYSLWFCAWGISNWALAFELWSQVQTRSGRIGLGLLLMSGIGEAMASGFDINNHPLHEIAGGIGIPAMPIAATLISVSLSRAQPWAKAKKSLLWASCLIWVTSILFAAAMLFWSSHFITRAVIWAHT